MAIIDTIRNAINKGVAAVSDKHVAQIWDLEDVPSFKEFWTDGIFPWKYVYKGYFAKWHNILEPTIADAANRRDIYRLNAAKFISMLTARYVWGEQCTVSATLIPADGVDVDEDEDPLNKFVAEVLKNNNFFVKLGELYEQTAALGGGCIKTWGEVNPGKPGVDMEGNILPAVPTTKIQLSYHMADQFVPTDWTNADIKGGIFINREARDGYYYTRLECHKMIDETLYTVTNKLFRERAEDVSRAKNQGTEPQTILGWEYPLNAVYPRLEPYVEMNNLEHSLFSYIKPSGVNNLDDNSPLGMSIYANAMDTLHAIDIAFDGFVNEVILSRKRVIVPSRSLTSTIDENGIPRRYFNPKDSIYEAFNFDNVEDLKVTEMKTEIRVQAYVDAINALLSVLCVQLGFDAGTVAFDKATGLKTATEVISQNSKTYSTVSSHQSILKEAIIKVVHNIIEVAALYGVEYEGTPISSFIESGYDVSVHFDDSIIQDRKADIEEGVLLNGAGLLSKRKFMKDTLGYTDKQVDEELAEIAEENKVDAPEVDEFDTTTKEVPPGEPKEPTEDEPGE